MFWQFPGEFCRQRAGAAEAATAATAGTRHASCEGDLVSPIPGHKTDQMSTAYLHSSCPSLLPDAKEHTGPRNLHWTEQNGGTCHRTIKE